MDEIEQRKNWLLEAISHVASAEYQNESWLGHSQSKVSSFEELVCQVFDDYDVDDFLDRSGETGLSLEQVALLRQFRDKFEAYSEEVSDPADPRAVLADPRWEEVRSLARRVVNSLGR